MKNKNIGLFALGRLVSLLGTFMYQFAAGLYVLSITGSGTKFAITLIMGTLPRVILAPVAGVVADRFNRKRIVVISDFLSGLILLGALAGVRGDMTVGVVYMTMVGLTACNTFFDIAIEAAKPALVETEVELEKINALSYGIHSFTSIVGPVLGGVVFALVSFKLFVLINGVSFILSGLSEILLKFHQQKMDSGKEGFFKALTGGAAYMKANRFSLVLMAFSLSINFCLTLSLTVPIPYLINTTFKMSPFWVGVGNAGFPLGYLLGTFYINARGVKNRGRVYLGGIWAVWGGMALIFAVTAFSAFVGRGPTTIFVALLLSAIGLAIAFIDIPLMTFLQSVIPSEVRGRVFSVMTMASRMAMPVAMLISGRLVSLWHPAYLVFVGTSIYLVVIILSVKTVYFKEYIETNSIEVKPYAQSAG